MIIKRNIKIADLSEEYIFRIITSGDAICSTEWNAQEVSPPYTRIYYILSGEGQIESDEGVLKLKEGFMYIIPAGYTFSHRCDSKMHQLYFHINLIGVEGNDLIRGVNKILSVKIAKSYSDKLLMLYKSEEKVHRQILKTLLQNDIFTAFEATNTPLFSIQLSECVKKAVAYIEENLSASLTVKEIAENIFVSVDTLAHSFKKEMGESVGKYIDGLVLYRVKCLLTTSDMTIEQISSKLGFCDQFYLSRRFKEKYLMSPIKYRQTHKTQKW